MHEDQRCCHSVIVSARSTFHQGSGHGLNCPGSHSAFKNVLSQLTGFAGQCEGGKKTLLIFLLTQAPITHLITPTGILCQPSVGFTGLLWQTLPCSLPLPLQRRHVPTTGLPCPSWPHSRSTVGTPMIAMPLWQGIIYRDNLFSDNCKFTQGS